MFLQSLLFLPFFLVLSVFFFTIPGFIILSKLKITQDNAESFITSTVVGFIIYTLLSYFFNLLNIHPILIGVYLILNSYFLSKSYPKFRQIFSKFHFKFTQKMSILAAVFLVGMTGQLAIIAPSGLNINGNILFWSSHGHDGPWHIALAQEIQKGFPFQNPVFAGEKLVNYHFFSDITIADFNSYFKLSFFDLYFRYFPLLFSFLLGGSAFIIGRIMGKRFSAGILAMCFTYFAGSWGYLITFIRNRDIGGEGMFWSSQVQSTIGNPPQIIASIIILVFLFFFKKFIEEKRIGLFIICTILASSLSVFKIYGSIVLLTSLGLVGVWEILFRRSFKIFLLTIINGIISIALYLPFSANSGSFLIFEPGWFIRTMIVAQDKLDWLDLERRKQTYLAEGNTKRVIQIHLTGFFIFLFGNLGMRFIGFWQLIKQSKDFYKSPFTLLILCILIISVMLPMLFVQRAVTANTIQFLQYFLIIMGVLSGIALASFLSLFRNNLIKLLIVMFILILAVPTQIGLIYSFYKRPAFTQIEKSELQALQFIKDNSPEDNIILTPPYERYKRITAPTPPIWAWFDTSYVTAMSNRRSYFADFEQVDIMGYDYKKRQQTQRELFATNNKNHFKTLLQGAEINLIYFPTEMQPIIDLSTVGFTKVYDRDSIQVWKKINSS